MLFVESSKQDKTLEAFKSILSFKYQSPEQKVIDFLKYFSEEKWTRICNTY